MADVAVGGLVDAEAVRMSERLVLMLEGAPRPVDARVLGPNGRAHWATKRTARSRLQLQVWVAARMQYPAEALPRFARARITYRLTVPQRRRRDADNFLGGAGKAMTDALVGLAVVPDDDTAHVEHAPVEWIVARGQRRVEIVVEALGGGES